MKTDKYSLPMKRRSKQNVQKGLQGFIKLAFILMLCTAMLCSCGTKQTELTGGTDYASGINLKTIDYTTDGEKLIFSLSFVEGSRNSSAPERAIDAVPKYTVTTLSYPARICVALSGVDYTDFTFAPNGQVAGVFGKKVNDSFNLYIQLFSDASVEVSSDGAVLKITAAPQKKQTKEKYVVAVNAYDNFDYTLNSNFTPALAADGKNHIMISEPYDSYSAAETYLNEIKNNFGEKQLYICTVEPGVFPEYNFDADAAGAPNDALLNANGASIVMQNGRFLCASPEGNHLYAESAAPNKNEDVEQVATERIWIEGKKDPVLESLTFYSVTDAAFSDDGRYVAVLDSSAAASLLYIYDLEKQMLINAGEEGFGSFTCSFVWDDSTVFAMTGDAAFQLMEYDLKTGTISSVEEQQGAISQIALANDKLFFSDGSDIYAACISDGTRNKVCAGLSVCASSDGSKIAVLSSEGGAEENALISVRVLDAKTYDEQAVLDNVQAESMVFVDNTLFVAVLADPVQSGYLYKIISIDGDKITDIGYSRTADIGADNKNKWLMLTDAVGSGEQELNITYKYEW